MGKIVIFKNQKRLSFNINSRILGFQITPIKMWAAKKIYLKIQATQEDQRIKEEKRKRYLEEQKKVTKLDYQILTLQVNPMAKNLIDVDSRESLKIYQSRVRAFRSN